MDKMLDEKNESKRVYEPTNVLEVYQPETILCAKAGTWVKLYAYYVIVSSAILMALGLMASFAWLYPTVDVATSPEEKKTAWYVFNAVLATLAIALGTRLFLGILLLRGTTKKIPSILWTWIIFLCIGLILSGVSGVLSIASGNFERFMEITLDAVISAFMVYVIRQRIEDIQRARSNTYVFMYPSV